MIKMVADAFFPAFDLEDGITTPGFNSVGRFK